MGDKNQQSHHRDISATLLSRKFRELQELPWGHAGELPSQLEKSHLPDLQVPVTQPPSILRLFSQTLSHVCLPLSYLKSEK